MVKSARIPHEIRGIRHESNTTLAFGRLPGNSSKFGRVPVCSHTLWCQSSVVCAIAIVGLDALRSVPDFWRKFKRHKRGDSLQNLTLDADWWTSNAGKRKEGMHCARQKFLSG